MFLIQSWSRLIRGVTSVQSLESELLRKILCKDCQNNLESVWLLLWLVQELACLVKAMPVKHGTGWSAALVSCFPGELLRRYSSPKDDKFTLKYSIPNSMQLDSKKLNPKQNYDKQFKDYVSESSITKTIRQKARWGKSWHIRDKKRGEILLISRVLASQ